MTSIFLKRGSESNLPLEAPFGEPYITDNGKMFVGMGTGKSLAHIGEGELVVNNTEPTTNLSEGLHWYNPDTKTFKIYANGAFETTATGSSAIVPERNTKTLSADSSSVTHDISNFNQNLDVLFVYKNSTYIEKDVDYTLSTDGTTINEINNNTWASGSEFNFVVLKSVPAKNVFKREQYTNKYTALGGESNISIGISEFNDNIDVLEVYEDNLKLYDGDQYLISTDGTSVDLQGYTATQGAVYQFVVWKEARVTGNVMDGGLLVDNTVVNNKLDTDAKVGSLSTLTTTDKSDVTSAMNEIKQQLDDNEIATWMRL